MNCSESTVTSRYDDDDDEDKQDKNSLTRLMREMNESQVSSNTTLMSSTVHHSHLKTLSQLLVVTRRARHSSQLPEDHVTHLLPVVLVGSPAVCRVDSLAVTRSQRSVETACFWLRSAPLSNYTHTDRQIDRQIHRDIGNDTERDHHRHLRPRVHNLQLTDYASHLIHSNVIERMLLKTSTSIFQLSLYTNYFCTTVNFHYYVCV